MPASATVPDQVNFHLLETVMKRTMKLVLPIVAGLILSSNISRPAHAQFAGDGGFEQMQQFAPMLEMMKKKRWARSVLP